MLPATPNPIVRRWFGWYCRRALRRHFHAVHVYGGAAFDRDRPTLYVANHVGFWDAIVVNHLIRSERMQPAYVMSELPAVTKHPFFRRVGAFSVDRTSPRDGLRAVRYAADLLSAGPNAVVVFPQGRVQSADVRQIRFEAGVERILSLAPANTAVVVIALRYEFWADQRPEVLMDVSAGVGRTTDVLRQQLADRMGALTEAGRANRPGERVLIRGRASIVEWSQRLPRMRPDRNSRCR